MWLPSLSTNRLDKEKSNPTELASSNAFGSYSSSKYSLSCSPFKEKDNASVIFTLIGLASAGVAQVGSFVVLVASILELIGLVMLGTSGSVNFKKALWVIVASLIASILIVIFATVNLPVVVLIVSVFVVLINIAYIFFVIKGCGEVSSSPKVKSFAKFIYLLALVALVCSILIAIFSGINNAALITTFSIIGNVASIGYNLLFVFCIISLFKAS